MKLTIYHLYPDLLDLYGDGGNVMTLASRCRWRGIDTEIRQVSLGEDLDFSQADIVFLGGGSDREQDLLIRDLSSRAQDLKQAIEEGLVLLAICGGYQLLGQYFQTCEGRRIPGLGILDFYTQAGKNRLIGNIIVELEDGLQQAISENYHAADFGPLPTLVGFENHSGKTYLGPGLHSLGKVLSGYGNNGEDSLEGVRYKNVFGTYLHGPFLPKNPHIADYLLALALKNNGQELPLSPLNDRLEVMAHKAIIDRFGNR